MFSSSSSSSSSFFFFRFFLFSFNSEFKKKCKTASFQEF